MPRPRIPNDVHKRRGSYRADRHAPPPPTYPTGTPEPPAWLSEASREQWDILVPLLAKSVALSPAYAIPLALLCDSMAHYIELCAEPPVIDGPDGPKRNPAEVAARAAYSQVMTLLREFGATPATAHKVAAASVGAPAKAVGITSCFNPKLVGHDE